MSKKTKKIATWVLLIVMVVGTLATFVGMLVAR